MKWFKHISDSLDDPDIFELVERFGGDGYMVFFGVLEVLSREFDQNSPGFCRVSVRFLTKKLQLSRQKLVKILKFCEEKGRIFSEIQGEQIMLNCPKLAELVDEYTKKQLRSESGATPEFVRKKSLPITEVRSKKEIIKSTSPIGDVCPEPKKSAPDPRPKKAPPSHEEYMTTARTEAADYIKANRDYLVAAYPCLSGPGGLEEETARAMAWLDANPNKRKKSIPRFLTNWFSRTQERGGHQRAANGGGYVTVEERNRRAAEEARKLIFNDGKPKKGGDGQ